MALWLVRAGKHGERENDALSKNVIAIGWIELPDLSSIKQRSELETLFLQKFPDTKKMSAANQLGQLWNFIKEIKVGDLVALPLKTQSAIALGKVEGEYQYGEIAPGIKHYRKVSWIKIIPRSEFEQDILYSLGAFMTVCRIERNNAENRVRAMLGKSEFHEKPEVVKTKEIVPEEHIEIEQYARDQLVKHIAAKFSGHNLARLVEAILMAQGYVTKNSPPGPDGGVDILAGSGAFGFESPKICVQVKSSPSPVDVGVLRELKSVARDNGADQALLISWGGFKDSVIKEANKSYFTVRLMNQGDLLDEITQHYDKFDDEIKAELPLKRIWAIVEEE